VVYFALSKNDCIDKGSTTTNILVSNFEEDARTYTWDSADMIGKVAGGADYNNYWFGFPLGTTLEEAQAKLDVAEVIVALAEPIETDITHLFPNFSGYIDITTEAGGSVFALNKHSLPVPWTITYITKA
jgi:hypothetical protein